MTSSTGISIWGTLLPSESMLLLFKNTLWQACVGSLLLNYTNSSLTGDNTPYSSFD